MKPSITYYSALARQMDQFVAFKRMQGYDYSDQARTLSYFDRFLVSGHDHTEGQFLTFDMLQRYVATTAYLAPASRKTRLASLREFSRYMNARCPHSVILPKDILPRHRRTVRFFPIAAEQVVDLMVATTTFLPAGSIRSRSISVLIGLLYSTGMRIREALALTLGDIDPGRLVLHVAKGKFSKQRLVPMSSSTLVALTHYLDIRKRYASTTRSAPLFIGAYDTALTYSYARDSFRRLCRQCGLSGDPPPRLHDLRHNYACRRLAMWREAGRDINVLLPILATAMGHVNIFSTQVYLHIDAGALQGAGTIFNSHFTAHSEFTQ